MKILILDIETTNFLNKGGYIVEIGIVQLDLTNGNKEVVFNEVCHEDGITKKDVETSWIVKNSDLSVDAIRRSRNLKLMKAEIQEIINNYPDGITAYNNKFDFDFMENRGFVFHNKLPCPMILSTPILKLPPKQSWKGGYKWPNVQEAYDYFFPNNQYRELHRGADDALHEADIVYKLYNQLVFKVK